jgi:hypothetical protein
VHAFPLAGAFTEPGTRRAAILKAKAVLGAGLMIAAHGLSDHELLDVAVMETSKIVGMQPQEVLGLFVAGRSENAYEIATYVMGKKQALEHLKVRMHAHAIQLYHLSTKLDATVYYHPRTYLRCLRTTYTLTLTYY